MDSCLKTFTALTYAFIVLRQFTALYSAVQQAAARAGNAGHFLMFFARFPTTAIDRAVIDLCYLSAAALLLFVHYYVMVNHLMQDRYRHRHFVLDLTAAFCFFANAETLSKIDVQRTFGWNQAWFTLILVCFVMMIRIALTQPPTGDNRVKFHAMNWYAIGAMCATLGWVVGKPRFDAIQTLDRIIAIGIMYLVIAWVLEVCAHPKKRRVDELLSAWPLAIGLLLVGSGARLLLASPIAEVIVQLRHRVPISAAQVLVSAAALLLIPKATGVDWNSVWRSLVESVAGIRAALKKAPEAQEAKK